MRALPILLTAVFAASCYLWPDGEFPPGGGERIDERPEYLLWWKLVESCSHLNKRMDVKWYTTNGRFIKYGDVLARGVYRPWPDRIALADPTNGPVTRHEMLHALLGGDGHPLDQFGVFCDGYINFRPPVDALGATAKEVAEAISVRSDSAVTVTVGTYPEKPSISQYGGHFVFIVTATNRTGKSIWANVSTRTVYVQLRTAAGESSLSEAIPFSNVFYRAGQSRQVLIDAKVTSTGTYDFYAGYGRAISPMKQLTVQR